MDDPNDIILAVVIGWVAVLAMLLLFLWRWGEWRRGQDTRRMHQGATMRDTRDEFDRDDRDEWDELDRELEELIREIGS
jgi:hypothetical protein